MIAQVREASLQKLVFGAGLLPTAGRACRKPQPQPVAHARLARGEQTVARQECTATGHGLDGLPNDNGWRWFTSALAQRQQTGDYDVNSVEVLGGRSKAPRTSTAPTFCATTPPAPRAERPADSAALSANYGWTGRYFNNNTAPTRAGALPWNWAPA